MMSGRWVWEPPAVGPGPARSERFKREQTSSGSAKRAVEWWPALLPEFGRPMPREIGGAWQA